MKGATVDELLDKLAEPASGTRTRSLRNLQLKPRAVDLSIGFDYDSATIQPGSRVLLESLATALQHERLIAQRFTVEGHTDAKGSATYNQRLSTRRAQAVVAFLSERGVNVDRLQAQGKGFTELLDPQRPFAAENRRVRITVLPAVEKSAGAPAPTGIPAAAQTATPGSAAVTASRTPSSSRASVASPAIPDQVSSASTGPVLLVTDQEALASRSAPPRLEPRSVPVPGAPRIELLQPDVTSPVPSPTAIQVRFEPAADAAIDPASFRVRYGTFRIDITSRITEAARITASGIDVPQAALPKGSHRLYIQIQDTLGRDAERRVTFTVE
jgi:outer membrane protein OmpA-like peptidoglycan-associated protein